MLGSECTSGKVCLFNEQESSGGWVFVAGEWGEATSLGKRAKGLSLGELTCWGVLETGSPQDMHLGHLLGVATQGTPAGAGGLIQAQLPGRGQEEGQVIEGVRTAEGEGVEEVERGRGAVFGLGPAHPGSTPCASSSSVSTQGKINSLSTYCVPSPLLGCYRFYV